MTILRHLNLNKKFIELQQRIIENGGVECEQVPEIFYPNEWATKQDTDEVRLAKQICNRCPIRNTCLDFALESNEAYGIWGSLTPEERRNLKRR
jgi:WhiB family redox-sensing transcriptional regulator